MSQEYQNEKSLILNGQKKPKTLGKVQKLTVLQAWEIYKVFLNTRYFSIFSYRIDFQEPKDPSHWIPGGKMINFDVKTIVLAQKL